MHSPADQCREGISPHAEALVRECSAAQEALIPFSAHQDNVLNLGVIRNMNFFHINEILIAFAPKYPEVNVNIIEDDEERLLRLYEYRKINICSACKLICQEHNMPYLPVYYTDIVALIVESDPLAQKEFKKLGITPTIIYEGYSPGAVDLVRVGMGVML